jgi:hypothetical protein
MDRNTRINVNAAFVMVIALMEPENPQEIPSTILLVDYVIVAPSFYLVIGQCKNTTFP